MDNSHYYGFRPVQGNAFVGSTQPGSVLRLPVASGYTAQDDGSGFNVNLNIGDPYKLVSDGSIALANTTDPVAGVIVGFEPYYDGAARRPTNFLPAGSTWSGEDQRPWALCQPVNGSLFEIDVDDAVTATTFAAYQALVGENVTHVCPGDSVTSRAEPYLDISLHATTAGLVWRIVGVSRTRHNEDYSGANVKLIVACNISQDPGQAATTIAGV